VFYFVFYSFLYSKKCANGHTALHQSRVLMVEFVPGQVDSVEKIERLLKGNVESSEDDNLTRWSSADYNCLLIEVWAHFSSDTLQT